MVALSTGVVNVGQQAKRLPSQKQQISWYIRIDIIKYVRINRSVQHFYIKALSLASFQRSSPTDKSACTQQVVTFHGSGAQQQLTWKHSGIAQQQTELLGNSPKQQRDAQQERRAWSQLRQCGGLSTQWKNNMQQPHQQIQMEQMHSQQYTSWSWNHQDTTATTQHSMNGNTSSQHTWAYKTLSTQH